MLQHIRVHEVTLLQGKGLLFCVLGRWLLGHRVDLALLLQRPIRLLSADAHKPGVQGHAITACPTEVTAVLVGDRIEA